jgi:hypothetical protein
MSVIMTLRASGDPEELERRAAANPEGMNAIVAKAKAHGLIAHGSTERPASSSSSMSGPTRRASSASSRRRALRSSR